MSHLLLWILGLADGMPVTGRKGSFVTSIAASVLLAGFAFSTNQFAFAQRTGNSNPDSSEADDLLRKMRALPLSMQSIRFRYTDGSEYDHEFSLNGSRWRTLTHRVASADQKARRYVKALSFNGKILQMGLSLPNGKTLQLNSTNFHRIPLGISVASNPMLLPYSWLVSPSNARAWSMVQSSKTWKTAIARMRFVKRQTVLAREAMVFKISSANVVHTVWCSIPEDGFPVKGQSVDLSTRSIRVWEVQELVKLADKTYLPTLIKITTDDLAPQLLTIDPASIELSSSHTDGEVPAIAGDYFATLDVEAPDFKSQFLEATGDLLPLGTSDSGTRYLDFAYGNGRKNNTDQEKANDETLETLADWDVTELEVVELGNNRGITDAGLRYLRPCRSMHTLYLYSTSVKGPGIRHLLGLTKLRSISLQRTPLSDVGSEILGRMPQLTWLNLGGTKISDAGITHLRNLQSIETLTLSYTDISDQSIPVLVELKSLRNLSVAGTKISREGAESLREHLPECSIATTYHLDKVPSSELLFPVGYMPNAEEINAKFRELGADAEVAVDSQNEHAIVSLRAFGVNWSSEVFIQLLNFMPELETLNTRNTFIDDVLMKKLDVPKIKYLDLSGSLVTDEGIRHLGTLKDLEQIHLRGTRVGDGGIRWLEQLSSLKTVTANYDVVSDEGRDQLRKFLKANKRRSQKN